MKFHAIRFVKALAITFVFIYFFHPIHKFSKKLNFETVPEPVEDSIDTTNSSVPDFHQIVYSLKPYTTYLPHFPDDEARDWFLKSTYYKIYSSKCPNNSCEKNGFLFDNTEEHLQVHLAFVKNGLYLNDDCGYKYSDEAIRRTFKSTRETSVIYDKAIIYTVPDGWSFQHFLDGIGPKLSHSRIYLDKYPDAKIILQHGARFDSAVREIWSLLGNAFFCRLIMKKFHE
jgi:hypothetical protein